MNSQWGEDGILKKIFELIGEGDKWCAEFGAWDGQTLNNTYEFIRERRWSAVLIEANLAKFENLRRRFAGHSEVKTICARVGVSGDKSLDNLLRGTGIPGSFSLLSIDIDGNDYHVWDSLKLFRPRVVVIEFNRTIPNHVKFIQENDPNVSQGCSLLALIQLGNEKGYELVATTMGNAIFVQRELFSLFGIRDNSASELHDDLQYQTRIFQLYDGTLVLDGETHFLWYSLPISTKRLQPLPKIFRKHPPGMSRPLSRLYSYFVRFIYR